MKKGFFASKNSNIMIRFLLIIIDLFSLFWTLTRKLNFNQFFIHLTSMRADLNCSYENLVSNKIRNPLTVCGLRLFLRIPLTNSSDSTNIPTKFTRQVLVRGIH